MTLYAILIGFLLDLLLGDPRWLPHPVVAMGKAISWLEKRLRGLFSSTESGEQWAGRVLVIVLVVGVGGLSFATLYVCSLVHPFLRLSVESIMCYQILATKELWRQSMNVFEALKLEDPFKRLSDARHALARIVGRDTQILDEEGIAKATVETVAENTNDGVVAPLVFLAIGGAPLGMIYKAINTMDSMIAYKNDTYLQFGRAAAHLDDAANYIPARFAALCMILAAPLSGLSLKHAWQIWRRDARNHTSPNAAQTESVAAGALGVQLGGDAIYQGERVEKPTIGDGKRVIEPVDIIRVDGLMLVTSLLALIVCAVLRYVVFGIWLGV